MSHFNPHELCICVDSHLILLSGLYLKKEHVNRNFLSGVTKTVETSIFKLGRAKFPRAPKKKKNSSNILFYFLDIVQNLYCARKEFIESNIFYVGRNFFEGD